VNHVHVTFECQSATTTVVNSNISNIFRKRARCFGPLGLDTKSTVDACTN